MMQKLLEQLLEVSEQRSTSANEWGFVSPDGRRISDVDHEGYAVDYLKKHNLRIPRYGVSRIAKFLGLTKYVRYYIEKNEIDFTIVGSVNSTQMRVIRQIGSRDKDIVYDIVDEQGDTLEYGVGISNLISSLRNMNLLENNKLYRKV